MDAVELGTLGALGAAVAALCGLYYQRVQIRLLERQTVLSERELDERVQSLDDIVKKLEEERQARQQGIDAERRERLRQAILAKDEFNSATLTFAGLHTRWGYQLALCVSLISNHLHRVAVSSSTEVLEARVVKDLATALIIVQVAFTELIDAQDEGEEVQKEKWERVNTAKEIFGLCSKRFEKTLASAGLPPIDLGEVLGRLQRGESAT